MNPWIYLPAAGQNLSSYESNCSLERERGGVRRFVQSTTWMLVRQHLRRRHRLESIGADQLPSHGPFVLVSNHTSHFDALILGASLPRAHSVRFFLLAAGDTFFSSPTRAALSSVFLNALPIWRKSCGGKALKALRSRLEGRIGRPGSILAMFPEGTRSRNGKMAHFKSGVGALVAGTRIPVVPACIWGAYDAWPPGASKPGRGDLTVKFGEARDYSGYLDKVEGWRSVARDLESRVGGLLDQPPSTKRERSRSGVEISAPFPQAHSISHS